MHLEYCWELQLRTSVSLAAILTGGLIVVDVDPLQLEVRITVVRAGGVDSVLVGDDLPEL